MTTVGDLKKFLEQFDDDTPIVEHAKSSYDDDWEVGYETSYIEDTFGTVNLVLNAKAKYGHMPVSAVGSHVYYGEHYSVSDINGARKTVERQNEREQERFNRDEKVYIKPRPPVFKDIPAEPDPSEVVTALVIDA